MMEDVFAWRNNVAAVIIDDEWNVLLGGNPARSSYWHFPQGGVGRKETLQEAVLREVREEVGLSPELLTPLFSYGGLRYRYRRKNEKREHWLGQQQTYFVLRVRGVKPGTCLSGSDEFSAVLWKPCWQLSANLFAPFKRPAVERLLSALFPVAKGCVDWEEDWRNRLTSARYQLPGGLACSTDETCLFGGGKDEVFLQMCDLQGRLEKLQRKRRGVVTLLASEGAGKSNCLRSLARCLDPLYTRAIAPEPCRDAKGAIRAAEPDSGQMLLLASGAYEVAVREHVRGGDWKSVVGLINDFEQRLVEQGAIVLKFFLHISYREYTSRVKKILYAPEEWERLFLAQREVLLATEREGAPWYVLPSDRHWYRSYLAARILAECLERSFPFEAESRG